MEPTMDARSASPLVPGDELRAALGRLAGGASRLLPPRLLRAGKSGLRIPRYRLGLARARAGHATHGHLYPHPHLFVAGLPKSGTSWLESLLARYPGYALVSHPEITLFDYSQGGTHRFEMPGDFFSRLGHALCVIKIHCHGSESNARILDRADVPYCVLYRDLRDAACSHVCYVKRTPWHPEYPVYRSLDLRSGLEHFGRTLLPEWRDWIDSWKRNRDPRRSLELRYEDMLDDVAGCMRRVVGLFGLPEEPLDGIIERFRFDRVRAGGSFYRKGEAGDWVQHFDAGLRDQYRGVIGEALVRWGYEEDLRW